MCVFKSTKLLVVCCYFPPPSSSFRISSESIISLLNIIETTECDHKIVTGDMNYSAIDWEILQSNIPSDHEFIETISEMKLQQQVQFKTTSSNILDIIFTSPKIETTDIQLVNNGILNISDHFPILFAFNMSAAGNFMRPNMKTSPTFSFCNGNFSILNENILKNAFQGICWSNVTVLLEQWYKWVNEHLGQVFPVRTKHRMSLPPWITPETSNMIKRLNTAKKKFPSESPKLKFMSENCDKAVEDDKSQYETLLSNGRSTSALFKYFRSFTKGTLPSVMKYNDHEATNDQEKANLFADFFQDMYISSSDIPVLNDNEPSIYPIITDFDLSDSRISSVCEKLDVTKSRGIDSLPPILFRNCPSIRHSLYQNFYKMKQTAKFPDQWKRSHLSPIHKKGNKSLVKNYRPVSLLSVPSKIFERCLFDSLYVHYEPFLHQSQYGFRRKRSCILQLIEYMDIIYEAFDNGKQLDVIYTDFEKAFDRVDHGLLMRKLHLTGVRGKLLSLISSYLSSRYQIVKVGDNVSYEFPVTSGVPQGSILGPLLFLVFINDLPSLSNFSTPLLAADDAKFIYTLSDTASLFQNELDTIFEWSIINNMPFNVTKCNHLTFNAKSMNTYFFDGNPIPRSTSQKDLGLVKSETMNWLPHIKQAANKANSVLYLIKRNSARLQTVTRLNLYKSMVLPILIYGSPAFSLNRGGMRLFESVQKRFCKWALGNEVSYKDCLIKLNILPIPYYLQLVDLLTLAKILNGTYNFDCASKFLNTSPLYFTRSAGASLFQCARPMKEVAEQNFWFRARRLANLCPIKLNEFGLKNKLLTWMWIVFVKSFSESNLCSWKTYCDCTTCRLLVNT